MERRKKEEVRWKEGLKYGEEEAGRRKEERKQ